ncbi:MAG TPA: phospholipase A [Burkholderiales bacterium]|nr:phospholipase A [Burkholderiales bacterium]
MRGLLVGLGFALCQGAAWGQTPQWLIASPDGRAVAGGEFEIIVVSVGSEPPPDELELRLKGSVVERIVPLRAVAPAAERRRSYLATMPPEVTGAVSLELAGERSSVLTLIVAPQPDVVSTFGVGHRRGEFEPPLSENDPMYFVFGGRDGYSARFQLSFKYRLFDFGSGFGREQPWLSGLYFGYTQNSLWDLSSDSKAFRDTSYRPSLFWKWDRADEKTFIDSVRVGLEHESNGRDGERSRSINIAFVRPEWRWTRDNGHSLDFTPKIYKYLDREENPDIHEYRGHVDWRLRYDALGEWIATAVLRRGTSGKGSFLLDLSRRARDMRVGPVSGYFHLQYFNGYGEDILDYNLKRKSQIRVGFAIVP